jgi:hypothetical protein
VSLRAQMWRWRRGERFSSVGVI